MKQNNRRIVYRTCAPVVDFYYAKDGEKTITEALTTAVATAEGISPIELPPIFEAIDLDALSLLFENHDGATEAEALLSFRFRQWNVFVRADGRIRVCDGTTYTDPEPVFERKPSVQ